MKIKSWNRRTIVILPILTFLYPSLAHADGRSVILDLLGRKQPQQCQEKAALDGTRARLAGIELPTRGKLVIVNIASQQLTAYQDGEVVFEMKVVVGAPETRTPEMQTTVSFVRFNPTWVVPQSIIHDQEWQERLKDPGFITDYGFIAYDGAGRRVRSSREAPISRLVQEASDDNALGLIKFGLRNGNTIYLHDTTAKAGFRASSRDTSHGCVRVEKPFELAAWMLNKTSSQAHHMQQQGDRVDHSTVGTVNVILGYFTAWPNSNGQVVYYPDIYQKDPYSCPGSMSYPTRVEDSVTEDPNLENEE